MPRTIRIGFRGFRTICTHKEPPLEGASYWKALKPLKPILMVLGVVLVVLELPPPSPFTEASEVWVRVARMPLTHRGPHWLWPGTLLG